MSCAVLAMPGIIVCRFPEHSNSKSREILTTKDTKSTKTFYIRFYLRGFRVLRGKSILKMSTLYWCIENCYPEQESVFIRVHLWFPSSQSAI
jgi:hypothetical protein